MGNVSQKYPCDARGLYIQKQSGNQQPNPFHTEITGSNFSLFAFPNKTASYAGQES